MAHLMHLTPYCTCKPYTSEQLWKAYIVISVPLLEVTGLANIGGGDWKIYAKYNFILLAGRHVRIQFVNGHPG